MAPDSIVQLVSLHNHTWAMSAQGDLFMLEDGFWSAYFHDLKGFRLAETASNLALNETELRVLMWEHTSHVPRPTHQWWEPIYRAAEGEQLTAAGAVLSAQTESRHSTLRERGSLDPTYNLLPDIMLAGYETDEYGGIQPFLLWMGGFDADWTRVDLSFEEKITHIAAHNQRLFFAAGRHVFELSTGSLEVIPKLLPTDLETAVAGFHAQDNSLYLWTYDGSVWRSSGYGQWRRADWALPSGTAQFTRAFGGLWALGDNGVLYRVDSIEPQHTVFSERLKVSVIDLFAFQPLCLAQHSLMLGGADGRVMTFDEFREHKPVRLVRPERLDFADKEEEPTPDPEPEPEPEPESPPKASKNQAR